MTNKSENSIPIQLADRIQHSNLPYERLRFCLAKHRDVQTFRLSFTTLPRPWLFRRAATPKLTRVYVRRAAVP